MNFTCFMFLLIVALTTVTAAKKYRRLRSREGARNTRRKQGKSSLGRHYGGHLQWNHPYGHLKQQHQQHLKDTSGIITADNVPLNAGIEAVLSQLRLTCSSPLHYRAFSLDISCPQDDSPLITDCNCLVKDEDGELIKKMIGETNSNNFCNCSSVRDKISSSQHVITRATCCSSARVTGGGHVQSPPSIQASTSSSSSIVYCPPETPYKTKYRSTTGSITCSNNRVMSKCLCLSPGGINRKTGLVQGNHCTCNQGKREYVGVTRAVCCSDNPDLDFGDIVQEQIPIP